MIDDTCALIGCGPRGLFVLDCLVAEAEKNTDAQLKMTIFEQADFPGAGLVYDPLQPLFLLMNFVSSHINAWAQRSTPPSHDRLNFCQWAMAHRPEYSDPSEYAPRAVVGEYLHYCFELVLAHLPNNLTANIVSKRVTALGRHKDGWTVHSDGTEFVFDKAIVATGHQHWQQHASPDSLAVFPIGEHLNESNCAPGSTVHVKGYGLTWIDAVLSFTVGRGGRFTGTDSAMEYLPSGREPARVVTFSRTGRPLLPKPGAGVDALMKRRYERHSPNEIFPICAGVIDSSTVEVWTANLLRLADAMCETVFGSALEAYEGFTGAIMTPETGRKYLNTAIEEAKGNAPPTPLTALGAIWRSAYLQLVEAVSFCKFSDRGAEAFIFLAKEMERIAFGPPLGNLQRILCLADAGILGLASHEIPDEVGIQVNATLPSYNAVDPRGPLHAMKTLGDYKLSPFGTFDVDACGQPMRKDGTLEGGLYLMGRMNEYTLLGHDSLNRKLNMTIENMAAKIVGNGSGGAEPVVEPETRVALDSCEGSIPLQAKLEAWMNSDLEFNKIDALMTTHGAPLNIHNPAPFIRNLKGYALVGERYGVSLTPYFARKANKALCYVEAARDGGFGVDVASLVEARQALELGVSPQRIVMTGAIKTREMLELCLEQGICVVLDNYDEIDLLSRIARDHGGIATVSIRLAGFSHESEILHSRFGFNIRDSDFVADMLCQDHSETLKLVGLHFHLDGYDVDHRVSAFQQCAALLDDLPQLSHIDIGGGIPMRYLADSSQWDTFHKAHANALSGEGAPITYRNHDLGRRPDGPQGLGATHAYPTAQRLVANDWVEKFLSADCNGEQTIAQFISARKLELRCEPGRSALAGCGMTATKVVHVKEDTLGNKMIGLQLNRTQFRTGFLEVMFDPILLKPKAPGIGSLEAHECRGYFTGSYCMESELIYIREFRFKSGISKGDIVVLPNTAGYLMHFLESRSHQFPLALNVVSTGDEKNYVVDEIDCRRQPVADSSTQQESLTVDAG